MITEVRVMGTGQSLWKGELPPEIGTIEVYDGIEVMWVALHSEEHWITLAEPAKVTLVGNCLQIEKLPPKPELPDRLEPVKNYLHRDWEIGDRGGVGADGWSIATVYTGIGMDGIGVGEMFKGNRSLIKNAPRIYEAMIALYNQYIDTYEDFDPDELEVLQSIANLAKEIQGECE